MSWLEVISIRLSDQENSESVLAVLRQIVETMPASADYDCYKRANIDSDWTFTLNHSDEEMEPGKSPLGHMIIEALRPFGLVNHIALVKTNVLENKINIGSGTTSSG